MDLDLEFELLLYGTSVVRDTLSFLYDVEIFWRRLQC